MTLNICDTLFKDFGFNVEETIEIFKTQPLWLTNWKHIIVSSTTIYYRADFQALSFDDIDTNKCQKYYFFNTQMIIMILWFFEILENL